MPENLNHLFFISKPLIFTWRGQKQLGKGMWEFWRTLWSLRRHWNCPVSYHLPPETSPHHPSHPLLCSGQCSELQGSTGPLVSPIIGLSEILLCSSRGNWAQWGPHDQELGLSGLLVLYCLNLGLGVGTKPSLGLLWLRWKAKLLKHLKVSPGAISD